MYSSGQARGLYLNVQPNLRIVLRPRSMEGGDLRWFWRSFDIYERVDNVFFQPLSLRYTNILSGL
jgi:hypothetical protein